jgi:hypothetical protein
MVVEPSTSPSTSPSTPAEGCPVGTTWNDTTKNCDSDPVVVPVVDNAIVLPTVNAPTVEITDNNDGTVTVTPIEETKTPTSQFETAHKCNILPFLFALISLLVLILFTHDAKKKQKHIQELREELELRKLGIDPETFKETEKNLAGSTDTAEEKSN